MFNWELLRIPYRAYSEGKSEGISKRLTRELSDIGNPENDWTRQVSRKGRKATLWCPAMTIVVVSEMVYNQSLLVLGEFEG